MNKCNMLKSHAVKTVREGVPSRQYSSSKKGGVAGMDNKKHCIVDEAHLSIPPTHDWPAQARYCGYGGKSLTCIRTPLLTGHMTRFLWKSNLDLLSHL